MQSLTNFVEKRLADEIGMNLQSVGTPTLTRALERRMRACEVDDPKAYRCLLSGSEEEWQQLVELMVVLETWFFRNQEAFAFLRRWCAEHGNSEELHILSVGCSTGEEPYSIAIACFESGFCPHIDAIDLSRRAISQAKKGLFRDNSFRGTDASFREKYFTTTDEGFLLNENIRKQVHFAYDNIVDSAFLTRGKCYDVVFCRNLLIYLHREAQLKVLQLLGEILTDDGALVMGPTDIDLLRHHGWQLVNHSRAYAFRRVPLPGEEKVIIPLPPPAVEEEDLLQQAKEFADQGCLEEAERLCSVYLEQNGPSAEVYFVLGIVQHAAGDLIEAENYLRKTIYLEPAHHQALVILALLAEKQGDLQQRDVYRKRAERVRQERIDHD